MDVGKQIGGTAAIDAARLIAAPDPIGLLTPKGELTRADGMRPSPSRTPSNTAASTALPVAPTVAELSDGAQLLLKLLGAGSQTSAGLQAAQPLLPEVPSFADGPAGAAAANATGATRHDTATVARALQSALETSGLFYESHLADWVGGQRSLDAIRTEPQALLHNSPAPSDANSKALADTDVANVANAPALHTLVNAQLDVIDSGQLRWQGELWPGMAAEIWLQRETPDNDGSHDRQRSGQEGGQDSNRRWQARLVTTLPVLGKISTQFSLQDDKLDLKLASSQAATAAVLQVAAPQLAGSLQTTGLTLNAFTSQVDTANHLTETQHASDAV